MYYLPDPPAVECHPQRLHCQPERVVVFTARGMFNLAFAFSALFSERKKLVAFCFRATVAGALRRTVAFLVQWRRHHDRGIDVVVGGAVRYYGPGSQEVFSFSVVVVVVVLVPRWVASTMWKEQQRECVLSVVSPRREGGLHVLSAGEHAAAAAAATASLLVLRPAQVCTAAPCAAAAATAAFVAMDVSLLFLGPVR